MDFEKRLNKIGRIIYLEEEWDVIVSKNWMRLDDVARVCEVLAELTGPENEEGVAHLAAHWVMSKLKNHRMLQRMLGGMVRLDDVTVEQPSTHDCYGNKIWPPGDLGN